MELSIESDLALNLLVFFEHKVFQHNTELICARLCNSVLILNVGMKD